MKTLLLAKIKNEACVGCTKCIAACPVDAIVGAQGMLHTVLPEVCIGCRLCIDPCPMDCIELMSLSISDEAKHTRAQTAKSRFQQRQRRLVQQKQKQLLPPDTPEQKNQIKAEIQAAITRVNQQRQGKVSWTQQP